MRAYVYRHPAPEWDRETEGQVFYNNRSTWGKRGFNNGLLMCIRYAVPELEELARENIEAFRTNAENMGLVDFYPHSDDDKDALLEAVYVAFGEAHFWA